MYLLVVDNGPILSLYKCLKWQYFFEKFSKICGVEFRRLELAKQEFEKQCGNIPGIVYVATEEIENDPDFAYLVAYLNQLKDTCKHEREDVTNKIRCLSEVDIKQLAYVLLLLDRGCDKFPKYLTEEDVLRKFVRNSKDLEEYFSKIFCSTKDILICYCKKNSNLKKTYHEYLEILKKNGRMLGHLPEPKDCFCCDGRGRL